MLPLLRCGLVLALVVLAAGGGAEERRGATYELLLTLPLRHRDLVLGKFLGALVFYLFCLSGSLVIPVVLQLLSTEGLGPDWGQIAAGYLDQHARVLKRAGAARVDVLTLARVVRVGVDPM